MEQAEVACDQTSAVTCYATYLLATGAMKAEPAAPLEAGFLGVGTIEKDLTRANGLHVIMGPLTICDTNNTRADAAEWPQGGCDPQTPLRAYLSQWMR